MTKESILLVHFLALEGGYIDVLQYYMSIERITRAFKLHDNLESEEPTNVHK